MMIIFTDKPQLLPIIQGHTGSTQMAIFNLSSAYSGYISITDLITHMNLIQTNGMPINQFIDDVSFDIQYANLVLGNPIMYHRFMMIMAQEFIGSTVVILVQRDTYRDAVMESLIKLIQQRYGINSWVVSGLEDVLNISMMNFTPMGLITIDSDINLHESLYRSGAVPERLFPDVNVE